MSRKAVFGTILVLLLAVSLGVAFNVRPVEAEGTVYIRSDGSIDPSTAPIQRIGDFYTLTDNIYGVTGIVIQRDSMTLDGAGYAVHGTGSGTGIDLSGRQNVTITNIEITEFSSGIWLSSSSNNTIVRNNLTDNGDEGFVTYGIAIWYSSNNNIVSENTISHTAAYGIGIEYSSDNNTICGNTIANTAMRLYYSYNSRIYHNNFNNNPQMNIVLSSAVWDDGYPSGGNCWSDYHGTDEDHDGIGDTPYIVGSGNTDNYPLMRKYGSVRNSNTNRVYLTIQSAIDAEETTGGHTIFVKEGTYHENVVIDEQISLVGENRSNTIIDADGTGIVTRVAVDNVNITGFTMQNSGYYDQGIRVCSTGNNIIDNIVKGNGDGIYLDSSSSSVVCQNIITENGVGVALYTSSANNITGNNVVENYWGVYMESSANNMFSHNNFAGNTQQVYIFTSFPNSWEGVYPSGGNYWSDYAGFDEKSGEGQNLPGGDGMGDTPYVVDGNNQDNYPLMVAWQSLSDVAIIEITLSDTVVTQKYPVDVNVTIENQGGHPELVHVKVYANNVVIGAVYFVVGSSSSRSLGVTWNTAGFKGQYTISAFVFPVPTETDLADNALDGGVVKVVGKGYFIIVAGGRSRQPPSSDQVQINLGCNEVFRTLRTVGYGGDEIYYVNQWEQDVDDDGINDVDNSSSSGAVDYAVRQWALSRVKPTEPLFIYMFDHGTNDTFAIDMSKGDYLYAGTLLLWLNYLEARTNASTHVIYAACRSGSFIDDLSKTGRVIVTSCGPEESSYYIPYLGLWEAFSKPFWNQIKSGSSIASSFNYACHMISSYGLSGSQNPLLDDDGNFEGNSGPLPSGGDGILARSLRIGACEWPFPWISYTVARQYFQWPPPPNVTLWAKIENGTSIVHVRALAVPPDWSLPPSDGEMVQIDLEYFEMADSDHDGNFTVDIPDEYFLNHASGASEFRFIVSAEEEGGNTATPLTLCAEFTETGQPPGDTVSPEIFIQRPYERQVVQDVIAINGTVMDDVCLKNIEFYLNGELLGGANLLPTSNSFFEFNIDTTTMPNGLQTIIAKIYDMFNNSASQTLNILVNNYIHDTVVTDIECSKRIVGQGFSTMAYVTVVNQGSYIETFNVTAHCNLTGYIESPDLVGYWKLDEGSGVTASDSSECNNSGFLFNAPMWTDGKWGKALNFDGVDDYVEIDAPLMKHLPLTLSAWIRPGLRLDGTDFPNNVISNDRPGYAGHGFGVNVWPGGSQMKVECECVRGQPEDAWRTVPGVTFSAGTWYHVAVVYTSGNVKTYIDGQLVDDFSYSQEDLDAADYFFIGKHNDDTNYGTRRFFSGDIDEARIYSRALGREEIVADMTQYYGEIGSETITLACGSSATINFTWNTNGFSKGNYTIIACSWPVLNETDLDDNMLIEGAVLVGVPCDITGPTPGVPDSVCNMRDIAYFCTKFMTTPASPGWDANCDVTGPSQKVPDGKVDMRDIAEACHHFLET